MMGSVKLIFTSFFVLFLFVESPTVNAAFRILTEELEPFGYTENGEIKGVCVEIVRELLKSVNHPDTIQVLPWERAYKETQINANRILFSVGRSEARESHFKWVGPILENTTYFYKNKEDPISLTSIDDARKAASISVRENYFSHSFLSKRGFDNLFFTRDEGLVYLMLASKRTDLIAVGELRLKPACKKHGIDCSVIENTGVKLSESKLYLAFSKDTPQAEITRWQKALDSLKNQPIFTKIVQKYVN